VYFSFAISMLHVRFSYVIKILLTYLLTMRDYHDAYLLTDTLLLANMFERIVCIKNYSLDRAHFYTTSGLSFQACLKMTNAKLNLFVDPVMHLFIENDVIGGVSIIATGMLYLKTLTQANRTRQNLLLSYVTSTQNIYTCMHYPHELHDRHDCTLAPKKFP